MRLPEASGQPPEGEGRDCQGRGMGVLTSAPGLGVLSLRPHQLTTLPAHFHDHEGARLGNLEWLLPGPARSRGALENCAVPRGTKNRSWEGSRRGTQHKKDLLRSRTGFSIAALPT